MSRIQYQQASHVSLLREQREWAGCSTGAAAIVSNTIVAPTAFCP
jgi:hypothetical protein